MRKTAILLIVGVFIIAVGSFALYRFMPVQDDAVSVNPDEEVALQLYSGDPIENIGNDAFIEQVPSEYLKSYKKELSELRETLAKNPGDFDGWLRLGVIKKFFNNYVGARDAWEYANAVASNNSTAYYNLGGLYGAYLKDYAKAETNYLAAIKNDPKLPYVYLGLAEFYSVFFPAKKDLADDVIRQGLEANPDDESLKGALKYYSAL